MYTHIIKNISNILFILQIPWINKKMEIKYRKYICVDICRECTAI